jgi:hypothetical protein
MDSRVSQERLADAGVVTSAGGWIVSHALEAAPVIQDIAGLIAIVAGLCAARYHWLKAQEIKRVGKD